MLVAAALLLVAALWLATFPGRLLLFMLGLARPEGFPNPQALLSGAPRVRRIDFPSESGRRIVADIYSPAGLPMRLRPRRPGILLLSPASREGLENPGMRRAAESCARLGYVAMVPFPFGEQLPHLSSQDVADTRASLVRFLQLPEVDPERSIGAGLSYGSGPLLLAAAGLPPSLRPSRYLVLGGYADLRTVLAFATTGAYEYGSLRGQHAPNPYIREMLGKTLVAWAAPEDRAPLRRLVEGTRETPPPELSDEGRRMAALYLNRDPGRFASLYAALPERIKASVRELSLPGKLTPLDGPVFILHPRDDEFVPPSEAYRLWDLLPERAREGLVLPPALSHGLPLEDEGAALGTFLKSLWDTYRFSNRAFFSAPVG